MGATGRLGGLSPMSVIHTPIRPRPAHLTEADYQLLHNCKSARGWSSAMSKIRRLHGGALPFNWSADVVCSGLMHRKHGEWDLDGIGTEECG